MDPSRNRFASMAYFAIISSIILGGLLSGCLCPGGFCPGGFLPGAFDRLPYNHVLLIYDWINCGFNLGIYSYNFILIQMTRLFCVFERKIETYSQFLLEHFGSFTHCANSVLIIPRVLNQVIVVFIF